MEQPCLCWFEPMSTLFGGSIKTDDALEVRNFKYLKETVHTKLSLTYLQHIEWISKNNNNKTGV